MKAWSIIPLFLGAVRAQYDCGYNGQPADCPCDVEFTYDKEWSESATNRFRTRIDFSGVDSYGNELDASWVTDNIGQLDDCAYRLNTQMWQTTDDAYADGQWLIDWGYTGGTGDYGACRSALANQWASEAGCSTSG